MSAVLDKNGRELRAGALARTYGRKRPGRVNAVEEATVWVEGQLYLRDPETGRCPDVELEEVGRV